VLSEDDELRTTGAKTRINYKGDFDQYLRLLHDGLAEKKQSVMDLFREWNKAFFPHLSEEDATSLTSPVVASQTELEVMSQLAADRSEEVGDLNEDEDA
jgi:hypothetical protein